MQWLGVRLAIKRPCIPVIVEARLLNYLWRSRIMNKTKLHLYRVFLLPMMLYGSECWTINKEDIQRIAAVDQWCLWRILDIRWHDFFRNADIHFMANRQPLSSIIKSRLLKILHLAQMDENTDASQAIFEPTPENWRWPRGWPCTTWMKNIHDDLSLLDLGIHEARDLEQNRGLWRLMSLHSATLIAVHATIVLEVVYIHMPMSLSTQHNLVWVNRLSGFADGNETAMCYTFQWCNHY